MLSLLSNARLYVASLLLLSACPRVAESFTLFATNPESVAGSSQSRGDRPRDSANPEDILNRVFVAGITPTCSERTIRSAFSRFGVVTDVVICGRIGSETQTRRERSPYCFVTFEDARSARRALGAPAPTGEYKEIRPAKPMASRRRSNRSRAKEAGRVSQIEDFGKRANLIVQVQSSHLNRVADYLGRFNRISHFAGVVEEEEGDQGPCDVLGSTKANSKNISLLFLSCEDPIEISREIYGNSLLVRAINKSYIVQAGSLTEGNLASERGRSKLAKLLFGISSQHNEAVSSVRVQTFPPKYQSSFLRSMENIIKENGDCPQEGSFTINPRNFTHMISVVEVYRYEGRRRERYGREDSHKLYMIGITTASLKYDVVDTNNIIINNDGGGEVSRAYYKLKEALETYEAVGGTLLDDLHGATALDCGSAPGGWTKCLIERFGCRRVYSVDPGSLAASVSEMGGTRHVRMKIQDALPLLLKEEDAAGKIGIWVSDMCLHDMAEQVDLLLLAKREGLLASSALFVLTLKCIVGRSKLSYDAQAEEAVDRLCATAKTDAVESFHLFSNRSGERTVMGYLV